MTPEEIQRMAFMLTIMNFGFNFGYERPRDISTDERMSRIEASLASIERRLDLLLGDQKAKGGNTLGK